MTSMSCCRHQLPRKLASSVVSDELLLRWLKGTYRGLKQLLLLHTGALTVETTRAARDLPITATGQACRPRCFTHPACSSCTARSALLLCRVGHRAKHEPAYSQQGNRRF